MSAPVDAVLAEVQARIPGTSVTRLAVSHPADDANLWFLRAPEAGAEVQIGSAPDGRAPFLIEGDQFGHRTEAATVHEAVEAAVAQLLRTDPDR